jgi:hypothetical protein
MTEIEAHQFIERWDRISFPQRWRSKTEAQTAHRLESLFIGIMCGAIAVMITSVDELVIEAVALVVLSFSFWLTLRSRTACRVLGYSQIANPKS